MIHVYAFAEGVDELPELEGVDGEPVERLHVDGVTTVFSRRVRNSDAETLRGDAVAHGAVVDALMGASAAVVPVRFGEHAEDAAALRETVSRRLETIRRSFERIRGCVEIGLRVWGGVEEPARLAANGTAYMRRRAAAERERLETVGTLHHRLETLARASVVSAPTPLPRERFAAAYLVPVDRIDRIRDEVETFGAAHPDLTVICTGPWAPYSFGEEAPQT